MQPDPTREEIERINSMVEHDGIPNAAAITLLEYALSEPDRIEAARREGIAEGIEKAARYFETLAAEAARGNDGITTAQRCYDARLVRKLIPATKATTPITEPPHA